MRLGVDFNILNQKGTPAFYSDIFANRPAAGFAGRVFISTNTGAIYEDTGSAWTLIADAGAGTTGTLEQVTTNGNTTTKGLVVTAGNIAIGTATAGAPLDIHGTGTNAQFNGTGTNNAYLQFQNAGASKWRIGNTYAAGANNFDIYNNGLTTTALSFNATTNAATFNGQIIGTNTIGFLNTPTNGTDVTSFKASNTSGYITIGIDNSTGGNYNNGAYSRWIYADGAYPMDFYTQALPRLRIAANGSVIAGTTNAGSLTAKFISYDATGDNQIVSVGGSPSIRFYNAVTSPTINGFIGMSTAANNFIQTSASGDMCIGNSTGGKVLIGTASGTVSPSIYVNTNGTVQIHGTATTSVFGITDSAKSGTDVPFTLSSNDGAASMQLYFQRVTNTQYNIQAIEQGVAYRSIYLNPNGGPVYAGAVRLDILSDKRVKNNIQPIDNALNKVLSITGKKFHLLDEEENKLRYGFIAQELEGVLDEFVVKTNMKFKKDDIEVENVLSVDNWGTSWAALIVEAIKEINNKLVKNNIN